MEIKKINLEMVDSILKNMVQNGYPIQQLDIFYRKTRNSQIDPLDTILENRITAEIAIPYYYLGNYKDNPVSMFQVKYTGANNLYARIIIDSIKDKEERKEDSNKKEKGDFRRNRGRMKHIAKNVRTKNNIDRIAKPFDPEKPHFDDSGKRIFDLPSEDDRIEVK